MTSAREQLLQQIGEQARLYLTYGGTKRAGLSVGQYLALITNGENLRIRGIGADRMNADELYELLLARITEAVSISAENQRLGPPTRASKQDLEKFWFEVKKEYGEMHKHPYLRHR